MIEMKNVNNLTLNGKNVVKISKPDGTVLWKKDLKWYEDKAYIASLTIDDIGTEQEVEVNGVIHKVRLIGIDHDVDENGNVIHTTWEFVNLISDENGYCLATYWKNTATTAGSNYDFLNSSIRKALTGKGDGDLHWFEKDSKTFSTTYADKTVLSMLPSDLASVLKNVKKKVNINTDGTWTLTDFTDKLFLLSTKEMGYTSSAAEDLPIYDYYKNHTSETDAIRIKYQPKWHDGARTEVLSGTDLDGEYTSTKYSYAGYNSSTQANGGVYWLRSPGSGFSNGAWFCGGGGYLNGSGYLVYYDAVGVAPAFCI